MLYHILHRDGYKSELKNGRRNVAQNEKAGKEKEVRRRGTEPHDTLRILRNDYNLNVLTGSIFYQVIVYNHCFL